MYMYLYVLCIFSTNNRPDCAIENKKKTFFSFFHHSPKLIKLFNSIDNGNMLCLLHIVCAYLVSV